MAHKKHNGKYLGHSFGSNRSQNLLRFEMYEIIEFWSKLGWNHLFVPQNLRVLLISLRHIMYCFVFHGPYDSPLTLKPRTSSFFSLFHRTINCVIFLYSFKLSSATKSQWLYLVLNIQETSYFYWHQFCYKNDGENICHWNYFQIPQALSVLPANWPGWFSPKGWLGLAS